MALDQPDRIARLAVLDILPVETAWEGAVREAYVKVLRRFFSGSESRVPPMEPNARLCFVPAGGGGGFPFAGRLLGRVPCHLD